MAERKRDSTEEHAMQGAQFGASNGLAVASRDGALRVTCSGGRATHVLTYAEADAVREFFRAEWEAEQGEVEWEYGATNVDDDRPVSIRATLDEGREAQDFYTRERGRRTRLMMRTKAIPAGPWVPVNENGSDQP